MTFHFRLQSLLQPLPEFSERPLGSGQDPARPRARQDVSSGNGEIWKTINHLKSLFVKWASFSLVIDLFKRQSNYHDWMIELKCTQAVLGLIRFYQSTSKLYSKTYELTFKANLEFPLVKKLLSVKYELQLNQAVNKVSSIGRLWDKQE